MVRKRYSDEDALKILREMALSDKMSLRRAGRFRSLALCENTLHSGTLKRVQRSSVWL
jgi:hypothetical protein